MGENKKYGLILKDKAKSQLTFQASRNVFGNDSDSEDDANRKPILLRPSDNINRQAKICQEKAINEDPTVYQYDEIYDEMVSQKEEVKMKTKEVKKPVYIENLLKTAQKRKIENERRIERQIQKEREKEGDEFADKEVFVTSAYKKKLEEMQLEEEKEKREEYLERIGDVTKQKDLGGFYRHLYEQKLGPNKHTETKETKDSANIDRKPDTVKTPKPADQSKKRNYRKRKSSTDKQPQLSDGEIESDEEIKRVNLEDIRKSKNSRSNEENIDADSDFSDDESSTDEEINNKNKEPSGDKDKNMFKKPPTPDDSKEDIKPELKPKEEKSDIPKTASATETTRDAKPKINIWKKRTVGDVFEQALKRYYERKAGRG